MGRFELPALGMPWKDPKPAAGRPSSGRTGADSCRWPTCPTGSPAFAVAESRNCGSQDSCGFPAGAVAERIAEPRNPASPFVRWRPLRKAAQIGALPKCPRFHTGSQPRQDATRKKPRRGPLAGRAQGSQSIPASRISDFTRKTVTALSPGGFALWSARPLGSRISKPRAFSKSRHRRQSCPLHTTDSKASLCT